MRVEERERERKTLNERTKRVENFVNLPVLIDFLRIEQAVRLWVRSRVLFGVESQEQR